MDYDKRLGRKSGGNMSPIQIDILGAFHFSLVFSPGFDFLTSSACNGLPCHQPDPLSRDTSPLQPVGGGFVPPSQNVNSLKGSLSPNFSPFFAPFLSRRVNTSLVEAFVIQNVFSLPSRLRFNQSCLSPALGCWHATLLTRLV